MHEKVFGVCFACAFSFHIRSPCFHHRQIDANHKKKMQLTTSAICCLDVTTNLTNSNLITSKSERIKVCGECENESETSDNESEISEKSK